MTVVPINLGYFRASREIEAACEDIRRLSARALARLKVETEARQKRIEAHLSEIENDVRDAMPSDCAFPEGA